MLIALAKPKIFIEDKCDFPDAAQAQGYLEQTPKKPAGAECRPFGTRYSPSFPFANTTEFNPNRIEKADARTKIKDTLRTRKMNPGKAWASAVIVSFVALVSKDFPVVPVALFNFKNCDLLRLFQS